VFRLLLLLFVTVPLVELYVLIYVGGFLGAGATILLCLLTAAIGAVLLRGQGLETLSRAQHKLEQGEVPAEEVIGGVILLVSGILLLTPGLVTDIVGFACLVPAFRARLARAVLKQMLEKQQARPGRDERIIVEGEYWEDDERKRLDR